MTAPAAPSVTVSFTPPLPPAQHLADDDEDDKAASMPKDDDDFLDLESIFNPQESALRLAEEARRDAVDEYKKAKQFYQSCKDKLSLLDANVVTLGGRSGLKGAAPSKPNGKKKRVFLRSKIQRILRASSRLNLEAIHSRIMGEVPNCASVKTSQALSAMKADHLAERDDNGGWALTKKGREAEMMTEEV